MRSKRYQLDLLRWESETKSSSDEDLSQPVDVHPVSLLYEWPSSLAFALSDVSPLLFEDEWPSSLASDLPDFPPLLLVEDEWPSS
eukprot:CAMPEP_0172426964 /NCGR_PEP_ID=MMETSP1064-20121228/39944_1 /TAXON_ID=202472 /ORGANISM="Aulacoseira subarctica , Strain CCAP 1002/5" /LENGTH=84 /DNA_ID=CAMNT_0013170883 /DNA_START=390 /DNA_END=644 /DNA_ORIENTATION=+